MTMVMSRKDFKINVSKRRKTMSTSSPSDDAGRAFVAILLSSQEDGKILMKASGIY